jgi:hypothetical protein
LPKVYERLQKWEEKITPFLAEEQEHREFDTNKYSEDLLNAFNGQIGSNINLVKVIVKL